jgi:Uma2 family endonuclease
MASIPSSVDLAGGGTNFSIYVPPGERSTSMFISDPDTSQRLIAERRESGADRWDEVWDGVYVMNPLPNNEHQELLSALSTALQIAVAWTGLGKVYPGVNVSDRGEGWQFNYRGPDVAVVLNTGIARDCLTHYQGGPDFLVEIISSGDNARGKIAFYSRIGVRELLVVDRAPWSLELYRLEAAELKLVNRSVLKQPTTLVSQALPLSFQLVAGQERPQIEIIHHDGVQRWLA